MALQMSYTDKSGRTSPDSYWRVEFVALDRTQKSGRIVFSGFHNSKMALEEKISIGIKEFSILGEEFDQYFNSEILDQKGFNIWQAAYEMVKPSNKEGDEKLISFFKEATDV